MRSHLIVRAVAALLLAGATACSGDETTPDAGSTTPDAGDTTPVMGWSYACALRPEDNEVACWGHGQQIGKAKLLGGPYVELDVAPSMGACARRADGSIVCATMRSTRRPARPRRRPAPGSLGLSERRQDPDADSVGDVHEAEHGVRHRVRPPRQRHRRVLGLRSEQLRAHEPPGRGVCVGPRLRGRDLRLRHERSPPLLGVLHPHAARLSDRRPTQL